MTEIKRGGKRRKKVEYRYMSIVYVSIVVRGGIAGVSCSDMLDPESKVPLDRDKKRD